MFARDLKASVARPHTGPSSSVAGPFSSVAGPSSSATAAPSSSAAAPSSSAAAAPFSSSVAAPFSSAAAAPFSSAAAAPFSSAAAAPFSSAAAAPSSSAAAHSSSAAAHSSSAVAAPLSSAAAAPFSSAATAPSGWSPYDQVFPSHVDNAYADDHSLLNGAPPLPLRQPEHPLPSLPTTASQQAYMALDSHETLAETKIRRQMEWNSASVAQREVLRLEHTQRKVLRKQVKDNERKKRKSIDSQSGETQIAKKVASSNLQGLPQYTTLHPAANAAFAAAIAAANAASSTNLATPSSSNLATTSSSSNLGAVYGTSATSRMHQHPGHTTPRDESPSSSEHASEAKDSTQSRKEKNKASAKRSRLRRKDDEDNVRSHVQTLKQVNEDLKKLNDEQELQIRTLTYHNHQLEHRYQSVLAQYHQQQQHQQHQNSGASLYPGQYQHAGNSGSSSGYSRNGTTHSNHHLHQHPQNTGHPGLPVANHSYASGQQTFGSPRQQAFGSPRQQPFESSPPQRQPFGPSLQQHSGMLRSPFRQPGHSGSHVNQQQEIFFNNSPRSTPNHSGHLLPGLIAGQSPATLSSARRCIFPQVEPSTDENIQTPILDPSSPICPLPSPLHLAFAQFDPDDPMIQTYDGNIGNLAANSLFQ